MPDEKIAETVAQVHDEETSDEIADSLRRPLNHVPCGLAGYMCGNRFGGKRQTDQFLLNPHLFKLTLTYLGELKLCVRRGDGRIWVISQCCTMEKMMVMTQGCISSHSQLLERPSKVHR